MLKTMQHLLNNKKIHLIIGIVIILAIIVFLLFKFLNIIIEKNKFFDNYDVLTVSGTESFSDTSIRLNGKVIEKTDRPWTNVLPIRNSLNYIKLTSTNTMNQDIQCGNEKILKRVESLNLGENEWCIDDNTNKFVSISSVDFFPYGNDYVVYEKCMRSAYYQTVDKSKGVNGCAERGLFLNDKKIATTVSDGTAKIGTPGASSFNYHPSKKVSNFIVYSTDEAVYSYNLNTEETVLISNNNEVKLEDFFLTDEGKSIYIYSESNPSDAGVFLGKLGIGENNIGHIYSANYIDGHFYLIKYSGSTDELSGSIKENVYSYELIIDGNKIANFKVTNPFMFGYYNKGVAAYPFCEYNTLVCVYEGGHYAYRNRTEIPDLYSYGFYVDEMIIDNETRSDKIPNLIGRSKPIFKDGKLDSIIYINSYGKGLYIANMNKKWSYKSFISNNRHVTRVLGGYQNKLLNVVPKI